jgi:hypothetical protein
MATDVYRPKDASKKYPTIFVRTPYNFNFWDVRIGAPRDMASELDAVKRGYVYVEMNERGKQPQIQGRHRRPPIDSCTIRFSKIQRGVAKSLGCQQHTSGPRPEL